MRYIRRWRLFVGPALFLADEFTLAAAAEGIHKGAWIGYGSILNVLLTLGFMFGRRS